MGTPNRTVRPYPQASSRPDPLLVHTSVDLARGIAGSNAELLPDGFIQEVHKPLWQKRKLRTPVDQDVILCVSGAS